MTRQVSPNPLLRRPPPASLPHSPLPPCPDVQRAGTRAPKLLRLRALRLIHIGPHLAPAPCVPTYPRPPILHQHQPTPGTPAATPRPRPSWKARPLASHTHGSHLTRFTTAPRASLSTFENNRSQREHFFMSTPTPITTHPAAHTHTAHA